MSKRIEFIDILKSTTGDPIELQSLFKYLQTYSPSDLDNDSIPNWGSVLEVIGSITPVRVGIDIDANPFTYASGITGTPPPQATIYLITGGLWQEVAKPVYDPVTGDMTTDVYTGVSGEDYILVVG